MNFSVPQTLSKYGTQKGRQPFMRSAEYRLYRLFGTWRTPNTKHHWVTCSSPRTRCWQRDCYFFVVFLAHIIRVSRSDGKHLILKGSVRSRYIPDRDRAGFRYFLLSVVSKMLTFDIQHDEYWESVGPAPLGINPFLLQVLLLQLCVDWGKKYKVFLVVFPFVPY